MGEKRKWHDPAGKNMVMTIPLPTPIRNTAASFSAADFKDFERFLDSCRSGPMTGIPWTVFHNMLQLEPKPRLARNLKRLIDLMVRHPIESIMRDGLDESELAALIALEKMDVGPTLKMTAQALLNVTERYQLAMALGPAFA